MLDSHKMCVDGNPVCIQMEQRTSRLTVLIDPQKKAVFEHFCALEDQTPSQVVRQLIREYIEHRLGRPWQPGETLEDILQR
jgi:Ribbon-helix-helix protein